MASGIAAPFRSGGTVSAGALPFRVTWTGVDATSGIARYELAQATNGGSWVSISSSLTSASAARSLAAGSSYRFRVRPVDRAGNIGSWAYGSTFTVGATQQTSSRISWSGTWKTGTSTSYWGGTSRYSTQAGAKATFKFTGRSFAWVASVGPTRGSARIYVNGTLVKTVSLYASTTASRRIVYAARWSTSATRTIVVTVVGTSGHPRIDLDALAWAS